MKDCLFCKIVNGDIPSKKIYESDLVIVFLDINPHSNAHMLIVPKKHYDDFTSIDEVLLEINNTAIKMKDLVYKKLNAVGLKQVVNYGINQDVKHYHMHLIFSYKVDNGLMDINEVYDILTK